MRTLILKKKVPTKKTGKILILKKKPPQKRVNPTRVA